MAGKTMKKRPREDLPKLKASKRQKKQQYHSSSEDENDGPDFQSVDLLDSDDNMQNAPPVDDRASDSEIPSGPDVEEEPAKSQNGRKQISEGNEDDSSDGYSSDAFSANGSAPGAKSKSKRNDPDAFSTSMQKILSSKLSTSKRADPVLSRSVEAHATSRGLQDAALAEKAKSKLREQKRLALDRGRIKDVLLPSRTPLIDATAGEADGETTSQIREREMELSRTARKAVVRLFNAFRAAQVQAAETERETRSEAGVGMARRKEKITEMSKQGFLDLLASGGGGLKKGGLEEA